MDKVQETQNAHSHSHNRSCSHNHNLEQEENSSNHPGGGSHSHSHSHSATASIQSPSPPGSSSASSSSIGSSFTSSLTSSNDHHHQHYSIPILTSSTQTSQIKSQAEINTSESGNQDILDLANSTMQFHNPFANVNSGEFTQQRSVQMSLFESEERVAKEGHARILEMIELVALASPKKVKFQSRAIFKFNSFSPHCLLRFS